MNTFKFLTGPFKGVRFQTTADLKQMNSMPNIPVVLLDKFAGLVTTTLMCYDQKIQEGPKWRKLLSNVHHI